MNASPIEQFKIWFEEAAQKEDLDHTAMTLATVTQDYQVSARIVLLKDFDEQGFVFFTNYDSPKAQCIAQVPHGALVFWWPKSARQVRITGTFTKVDAAISDQYFSSRPKGSQISATISEQSAIIPDRDYLESRYKALSTEYADKELPRPDNWGGYILVPQKIEFWQDGTHRLHDRFLYCKHSQAAGTWEIVRLAP